MFDQLILDNIPRNYLVSSMNKNDVKIILRKVRSGGCVAPAKKGLFGLPNKPVGGRAGNKKQGLPGCCYSGRPNNAKRKAD